MDTAVKWLIIGNIEGAIIALSPFLIQWLRDWWRR
jgi:hypothetical protein